MEKRQEEIGGRKSQLEGKSLKLASIQIKKKKTKQNKKKHPICESNDKHKEQQKDKHEDVKRDIKIIKCG